MSQTVMYRDLTARTRPQPLCIAIGLKVNGCENLCERPCLQPLLIAIGLIVNGCERLCVRTYHQLFFIAIGLTVHVSDARKNQRAFH